MDSHGEEDRHDSGRFQKERKEQVLENHRSIGLIFPGKVVVWVIEEEACAPKTSREL